MTSFQTRLRPLAALLAGAIALGTLSGAALAQDRKVQHAQGETSIPANPQRVLAFDLSALDTLTALGVEVSGVPTTRMPDYLSKYSDAKYEKVGTLFEPDFEAVNAAEPDLIIVGGRSRAKYAELSKIAPTIDVSADPKDFMASVARNTRLLGEIFGKRAEADVLLAKLDASIAGLRQAAPKAGKGLLILTTGGKMSAYGPGSRFGVLHDAFGVTPAATNLATTNHGQAISSEFILQTNPDWLFVIDRDAAIGREGKSAKAMLDNELVAQTTAWKNNQVVYLNPVSWYVVGSGITGLQESVDQIATAIARK